MPLVQDKDRQAVQTEFAQGLKNPVKLIVFTQSFECQHCATNRQLAEEVASLSDQIELEVYNFVTDKHIAERYNIDKIPAVAIVGERDYGVRFYGIPSGYEFSSLIGSIIDISQSASRLTGETRQALAGLNQALHLQVLVTPTCPYCPPAVRLAHKFAIESEHIRADMVEVSEFPHLVQKYQVMGVPRTVINASHFVEGAATEAVLLAHILAALEPAAE